LAQPELELGRNLLNLLFVYYKKQEIMKKTRKISVITLGCSKNTVDSERLMRQMDANHFKLTDNPEDADTIVINTCGFIDAAKEESVNTILSAVALKNSGKIKKVIVSGCLSERYKSDLMKEIPEVDAYFGTEKYAEIISELGGDLKRDLLGERRLSTPSHTAYLKISEGCDHPCSFCAIPIMRGRHVSRPAEELLKETQFLADAGVKELVIIAQDTTDYGRDIYGKPAIDKLLNDISGINGIEWIRLMYAYPSKFPDSLIDTIASNDKICSYIDIPLQHISDDVLRSMRRGVTAKRTRELLYKLREKIPGLVLRTTFITGYPNETENDFKELYNFVEEIKFEKMGVFTYSVEENTTSYILGDPVSPEVKQERKDALMQLQSEISAEKNKALIGEVMDVLVERKEGDFYIGRTYRDAPEVDGEVLLNAGGLTLEAGKFYSSEFYDFNEYDLYAKPALKKRKIA
jgi:ribosomal protein S12 methylthiotransferase